MSFKEWLQLQEVGTSTGDVAVFSRPVGIGMVKRTPIPSIGNDDKDDDDDDDDKKKKKKKK